MEIYKSIYWRIRCEIVQVEKFNNDTISIFFNSYTAYRHLFRYFCTICLGVSYSCITRSINLKLAKKLATMNHFN